MVTDTDSESSARGQKRAASPSDWLALPGGPRIDLPLHWQIAAVWILLPLLLCLIAIAGLTGGFLLFHTLAEFISVVIGLVTLTVASASYRFTRNFFIIFVAIALGWTTILDLVHALAYHGMQVIPGDEATWSSQLWIAGRSMQAVSLVIAPLFVNRPFRVAALHFWLGVYVLLAMTAVFTGNFPTTFVEGSGLTPFKIWAEYAIIALLLGAMAHLWLQRAYLSLPQRAGLLGAMALMILSEIAFTQYVSLYGIANVVGHLLKIFSYWFVFVALVRATLVKPFEAMAQAAATYDAVPDATLIVDHNGLILQANPAAATLSGQDERSLPGASAHALFHEPNTEVAHCEVCQKSSNSDAHASVRVLRNGKALQCTVAPYTRVEGLRAHVQVFHDITTLQEQKKEAQFQAERTAALLNLTQAAPGLDEMAFLQYGQELAEALTQSQIAFVHIVNEDQETIEHVAWSRRTLAEYCHASYDKHYPITKAGIWADAFRTKAAVVINDYATATGKRGLPDGHSHLLRLISVPVLDGDKVRLMTGVGNKATAYTDRDVETVRLVSDAMWAIVQRRRSEAAQAERERQLSALLAAIPDPVWLKDRDGRYLAVNPAFASVSGKPVHAVLGHTDAELLEPAHASLFEQSDQQVLATAAPLTQELRLDFASREGHSVALTTKVPVLDPAGEVVGLVGIARDITESRRLAVEREALLSDLGERIKELSCLAAVSALTELPNATASSILAGTVGLLPRAFQFPDRLRAGATGVYGTFGEVSLHPCRLDRILRVGSRSVGTLSVSYVDTDLPAAQAFLAEEVTLLDMVVSRLCLALERQEARLELDLQVRLYDTLSATNRAVVHARTEEQLLAALFEAMVEKAGMTAVAVVQLGTEAVAPALLMAHGDPGLTADKLPDWLEPNGALGRYLWQLQAGSVVTLPADRDKGPRALVPLRRGGVLSHIVLLAGNSEESLGLGHLRLLDEIASDMAYAFTAIATDQARDLATQRHQMSEARFARVFAATPVPMLIVDHPTGAITAVNDALVQWLGYPPAEIPNLAAWFAAVYPDVAVQQAVLQAWEQAVARSAEHQTAEPSPELELRRKDGGTVIARGATVSLGDQNIVVWQDWTEIRRGEAALRESEQRFRGMIEQTVTGIFVRQGEAFAYVNNAFCTMVGYSREELLGKPVMELLASDPDTRAQMLALREKLKQGVKNLHTNLPMVNKTGDTRLLTMHGTPIDWQGGQGIIVMVEDTTERTLTEQRIAQYIKQLEGAMRGTLEVVARMVDLRDPYTAGHERRVGLIAKAIGTELGWSPERCDALELMGMVHDVGKIAIPTEILTKPGRLTSIEFQIVQSHAETGWEILRHVSFGLPVAEVVYQHHERMDGSGYPRGLAGDAILPEARVLAVADVVESMASHRPYRPSLGLDAALAELERGRGTLYDPEVVGALLRLVHEKAYVLPQ